MTERIVALRGWFEGPGGPEPRELSVDPEGRVAEEGDRSPSGVLAEYGEGCRIRPGEVNAHSHPEQSVYTELVDPSWDLATWCRHTIYRRSVEMTPELVYLGCCRAFGRMLLAGVTTVAVSFYCHNRRGNDLDRQVIRAARTTGIRLLFGRMHYDWVAQEAYPAKRASQESYFETPEAYEEALAELLDEVRGDPLVAVAPALHSFHANTREGILQGILRGARLGLPVQFHLSEDEGDVDLCLRHYGKRPVEVLDELVALGEVPGLDRLLVSDGIWVDDHEKDLLAAHRMSLVVNLRMNRRVRAGRVDLKAYLDRGIPVYLGTDGEASNDDLDVAHERDFARAAYPEIPGPALEALGRGAFPFPGTPVGLLERGFGADVQVRRDGAVEDVYVAGRRVVHGGRLATLDLERDVEAPLRDLTASWRE